MVASRKSSGSGESVRLRQKEDVVTKRWRNLRVCRLPSADTFLPTELSHKVNWEREQGRGEACTQSTFSFIRTPNNPHMVSIALNLSNLIHRI